MSTDPAKLPQWNDRAVPWIARWSGQVRSEPIKIATGRNGSPAYFTYESPSEMRDAHQVLWLREGTKRIGDPQFAMVSTLRQRMAMNRRLCQICGNKITTEVTPWLLDPMAYDEFTRLDPHVTQVAPVCVDCIPLALELCPHLKKAGYHFLKVARYSIWGVYGETLLSGQRRLGAVGYDEKFRLPVTLARQQLVTLDEWEEVDLSWLELAS